MSNTDLKKLPIFLDVGDVAELLRCSKKAVYVRIQRGGMPGVVRFGGRVLVERDELISWLRESRSSSSESRR